GAGQCGTTCAQNMTQSMLHRLLNPLSTRPYMINKIDNVIEAWWNWQPLIWRVQRFDVWLLASTQ
ncbi:MAG: hypothetical protein KGQ42_02035, partial [Alphaproteobacteria bacterium]|nr:hypothetical protein [Alphaproteobacteria bacterium]